MLSEPSMRALDAARHRRIEQGHARGREIARELLGVDRIGRAHVDGDRARRQALARGVAPLDQRLPHHLAVGQHGDQRVGALRPRPWAKPSPAPKDGRR